MNLTQKSIREEEIPEQLLQDYIGGKGLAAHYGYTEIPPHADPLGPENRLIFALGPITGHPFPGNGRNSVGAKSPLSGGFGESEAGGFWGAELKKSGYDAIISGRKADQPVYLWIKDGQAEMRDAGRIWGLDVAGTEKAIREQLQDGRVRIKPPSVLQERNSCGMPRSATTLPM